MPKSADATLKKDIKKLIIIFFLIIFASIVVVVLMVNALIQKSFCAFDELPTSKEVKEACENTPWYHFIFSSDPVDSNTYESIHDIPYSLTQ